MVVTAGAIRCESSSQIITNKPTSNFLQAGWMPFLSPSKLCQSPDEQKQQLSLGRTVCTQTSTFDAVVSALENWLSAR